MPVESQPQDFGAAMARVHSDYEFYVQCQADPEQALAAYDLTPEERAALQDPALLAERLRQKSISITISGTHDWVNRTAPSTDEPIKKDLDEAVEAVRSAASDDERHAASLRLVQLLG